MRIVDAIANLRQLGDGTITSKKNCDVWLGILTRKNEREREKITLVLYALSRVARVGETS